MSVNEDFTTRRKIADIGRWFINEFVEHVSGELPVGCSILDAGAGEGAYKKYFRHCNYKAVDLGVGDERWNYGNLDYVAPLHDLPIEDYTFDAILCTQVLEHLEYPRESVEEFYRVLKVGGKLYLTAPMAHVEHQTPYDFFRYTSFGLRSILAEAGFKEIVVKPFGGMFTRWAYELPRAMAVFPGAGLRQGKTNIKGITVLPVRVLAYVLIRATQRGLLRLEKLDKHKNDPFGWSVVASKE